MLRFLPKTPAGGKYMFNPAAVASSPARSPFFFSISGGNNTLVVFYNLYGCPSVRPSVDWGRSRPVGRSALSSLLALRRWSISSTYDPPKEEARNELQKLLNTFAFILR